MERSWKWRRLMVFIIVVACLGLLYGALYLGGSDLVRQTVVQAAFVCLTVVAGAYLGIAAWDDKNKAKEVLDGITDKLTKGDQQ